LAAARVAARRIRTLRREGPPAGAARTAGRTRRQHGKLAIEALKAEVDLEPLRVFDEESARELDVL
jgi:hypothetical protein